MDRKLEGSAERQRIADTVAEELVSWMVELIADGQPLDSVLAGAMAGVTTAMTMLKGGPETARTCRKAAAMVSDRPSLAALAAAMGKPAGRA